MRIGLIGSRGYPSTYGGYETFVREFAPHAVERGHEVIVYCRANAGRDRSWKVDGVECRFTPGLDTQYLSTLTFGLTSAYDSRRRHLDAALVLNCANGYWLGLIRRAGVPVALNVDGLEWERRKWNRLGRGLFRAGAALAARYGDALVGDSRAIVEVWNRRFGVRPRFIPYGAHLVDDDSADELQGVGLEPGSYALTVSRLVPENNVELTLDALAMLHPDERPAHVVVGSAQRPSALERRLSQLALKRPDVHWLGHVTNRRLLTQLYRHCAIYVHGHSVGGTNPALLEALGAGAPVLAFDTAFNREVLGELDAYYDSAPSLSRALGRTLGSPQLRRELSRAGQHQVRTRYSWPDVCDRYLALLQELAAVGATRRAATGGE